VLSFCYCVRTRFVDVNIFYSPSFETADAMQIETLMGRMAALLARIALPASFTLDLDSATFNDTIVSWLTNPDDNPKVHQHPDSSIVGLCCSSLLSIQLQEDDNATDTDGTNLLSEFRTFLLASSLAHSGWRGKRRGGNGDSMTRHDLSTASHVSGYRLIKRLDRVLTPQFLSQCSPEYCQVLFLLVLGMVLGIGYSPPPADSPSFPADKMSVEFQQSPTLWLAMKQHLCEMLAHHLIFLGSMLGIKLETGVERRIIETAVQRWNKMEAFVWAEGVVPSSDVSTTTMTTTAKGKERLMDLAGGQMDAQQTDDQDRNPGYSKPEDPPPSSTGYDRPLVPIACPELAQFRGVDQWSENPASYLDMPDDFESEGCAEPEAFYREEERGIVLQRSHTEPASLGRHDGAFVPLSSDTCREEH